MKKSPVVENAAAIAPLEIIYTLLGVRPDGVASVMDVLAADDLQQARDRAEALLREHQSCDLVEVWCDGALIDKFARRLAG